MKLLHTLAVLILLVAAVGGGVSAQTGPQTPAALCESASADEPETREFSEAEQVLEAGVDYRAIFCTSVGAIYIDLLEEVAPMTVNSFVFLAQNGYYNNTTFHRVIDQFMAQGGDPTGTGRGGPGYEFGDEFVGFLTFDRAGWLAMANAGPGTNGSQFFITTVATPHLDFQHTIFGEVLEGQDTVEAIELRDPATSSEPGTALTTVVIVDDPAAVESTYVAPPAATQDEVAAIIDVITSEVPAPLSVDGEQSGIFSDAIAVASAPEAVRDALASALTDASFSYRAQISISNAECDLQTAQYTLLRYTLDSFGSRDDASAALASGIYAQVAEAGGYAVDPTFTSLPNPVYTQNTTACDTEVVDALSFWQRGQYVVTVRAVVPTEASPFVDRYLSELVGGIFEGYLSDALRAQLR